MCLDGCTTVLCYSIAPRIVLYQLMCLDGCITGLTNVEYIPNFGYNHYHHPLPALRKDIDVLFTGQSYARWQPIVQGMGSARIKYVQVSRSIPMQYSLTLSLFA